MDLSNLGYFFVLQQRTQQRLCEQAKKIVQLLKWVICDGNQLALAIHVILAKANIFQGGSILWFILLFVYERATHSSSKGILSIHMKN